MPKRLPARMIDDVVFQAAALRDAESFSSGRGSPVLSVTLPASADPKGFVQAVPFFARRPPIKADHSSWPVYCGLLKQLGIPLRAQVNALEQLPVVNVPHRFAWRPVDEGFQAIEIETAEAIEIRCIADRSGTSIAQLPIEIHGWEELRMQVDCLRDLTGGRTPIGLGLLVGDIGADVPNALATRVDFIVLEAACAEPEIACDLIAWATTAARQVCVHAKNPSFPILVDAPIARAEDLIKLLALGASALSIDALTAQGMPASPTQTGYTGKGMLSGIGSLPAAPTPTLAAVEIELRDLIEKLTIRLQIQNLQHVSQLNPDHLRAMSDQVAQIYGLKRLWNAS